MKFLNINEFRQVLEKRFGAKAFYNELEIEKALEKMSDKGWRDFREETVKPILYRSFNFNDWEQLNEQKSVKLEDFTSSLVKNLNKELEDQGFDLDKEMIFTPHAYNARGLKISQAYEKDDVQKETHGEFLARVQHMLRQEIDA